MELPLKEDLKLTEPEVWLVEQTREIFEEVHTTVTASFPSLGDFTEGYEREMVLRKGIRPVLSGHCDFWRYYPTEKLAVIIDAKFGFIEVTAAPLNVQLRAYATMIAQEWDVEAAVVAIAQPRAHMIEGAERMTIAQYSRADLDLAKAQILEWEKAWLAPGAPRSPSEDACRYCKAKLLCPEFKARMTVEIPAEKSLADVPVDEFARLYEGWKAANSDTVGDMLKAEARLRITEGRMPGYRLKLNAARRSITDELQAAAILRDKLNFTPDEIAAASSLALGEAVKVLRKKVKFKNEGLATAYLRETLAPVIALKTPDPSIVVDDTKAIV